MERGTPMSNSEARKRLPSAEAVALRQAIEALADKYGSVDYSFSGRTVSQSLRTLLTTVTSPGVDQ